MKREERREKCAAAALAHAHAHGDTGTPDMRVKSTANFLNWRRLVWLCNSGQSAEDRKRAAGGDIGRKQIDGGREIRAHVAQVNSMT